MRILNHLFLNLIWKCLSRVPSFRIRDLLRSQDQHWTQGLLLSLSQTVNVDLHFRLLILTVLSVVANMNWIVTGASCPSPSLDSLYLDWGINRTCGQGGPGTFTDGRSRRPSNSDQECQGCWTPQYLGRRTCRNGNTYMTYSFQRLLEKRLRC